LGGVTSHTSLLAKSLNLPTVVGFGLDVDRVKSGDRVILDAYSGRLLVNPDGKTVNFYRDRQSLSAELTRKFQQECHKPAVTKDRHRIRILNNIELPSEASRVIYSGADGIGLFRTEYLFFKRHGISELRKAISDLPANLEKMGTSRGYSDV
jgi:phosphotransferase system enzyme I (PtsI)